MNGFLKKVAMAVIVILSTTVASAQMAQEVVYLKNGSVIHGIIIEFIPNESLKIQTADGNIFAYKMSEVLSTNVASDQTAREVVYLKNGSVIHGVIIELTANESLKIQTADGNIFVYKMSEVEKVTKEATLKSRSNGGSVYHCYDGRWNEFTFDIGFGKDHYIGNDYDIDDENIYLFSFNYACGIHICRDKGLKPLSLRQRTDSLPQRGSFVSENRVNGLTLRPSVGLLVGYQNVKYIDVDYKRYYIVAP